MARHRVLNRKALRAEQKRDQRLGALEPLDGVPVKPRTREDCCNGARPCPFVSCRFNLVLDVTPVGSLLLNHPGKDLEELAETCALDVAERGGATLSEVGELLGITRERVRQIEEEAVAKLQAGPIAA